MRIGFIGLGRMGAIAYNSSGDLFVGFGLAQPEPGANGIELWRALGNEKLDPLLQAAVQAVQAKRRASHPGRRASALERA